MPKVTKEQALETLQNRLPELAAELRELHHLLIALNGLCECDPSEVLGDDASYDRLMILAAMGYAVVLEYAERTKMVDAGAYPPPTP